jgi:Flp pilus assembly protein TadB
MKKWIGPVLSFCFVLLLGIGLLSGSFSFLKKEIPKEMKREGNLIRLVQDEEKRGETDSHYIQLLKEIEKERKSIMSQQTMMIYFISFLFLAIILMPTWDFTNLWPLLIVAIAIPLMVILRHRENIKRLKAGIENKI